MSSWWEPAGAALLSSLLVGCSARSCGAGDGARRAMPEPIEAGVPVAPPRPALPPDASAALDASTPAAITPIEAGARARPLLVERLEGRRVAVLLDPEPPPKSEGKTPSMLARHGILAAGVEMDRARLSERARAALATTYRLGDVGGIRGADAGAPCTGRLVNVVEVARIVEDDPTASSLPEPEPERAKAIFAGDSHSVAAVVELDRACTVVKWAVPEGVPLPVPKRVAPADAGMSRRVRGVLASATEGYGRLPKGPDWKEDVEIATIGDTHVWVRFVRSQPGSPAMVCALFDVTASKPKLLAEGSSCPESLVGATASGDVIDLWFGSAVARVSGRELDLTYFYATWTVPYGVP